MVESMKNFVAERLEQRRFHAVYNIRATRLLATAIRELSPRTLDAAPLRKPV
jgi:hypothetical protein